MITPEKLSQNTQEELLAGPPQPGTVGALIELTRELTDPKNPEEGGYFEFAGMKMGDHPLSKSSRIVAHFCPKEATDDSAPAETFIVELDIVIDRTDDLLSRRFLIMRNGKMKKFERAMSRANFVDERTGLEFMPDEEKEVETNEKEIRGLIKLLESVKKGEAPSS